MAERDFDVVVFGATGVTGRRVAAYLAERAEQTGARWAAAGRDAAKVERVLAEVGVSGAQTIVADVGNPASLQAMAARTRVVLNLVGPYTLYGWPVIEACVAGGAHYADLTGEIPFVRRVIDAFDARAAAAEVKLVQVCGFECLPPDLAVLLAAETARERWGEGLADAELAVSVRQPPGMPRLSDAISGGTLQSLAAVMGAEDPSVATDPAALITDPVAAAEVRRVSPISVAPRLGPDGAVIAPMAPAAFINPAVIQRTAVLLAAGDGRRSAPFSYREGMVLAGSSATLPLRYGMAGMLAGMQAGFAALSRAQPSVRRRLADVLGNILPGSGFGPAADRLQNWTWRMSLKAHTAGGHGLTVEVSAEGHPGYLATARMLGEAGLILAAVDLAPKRSGCLTPAAALGTGSLERFEHARLRFAVGGGT
ncbi:MAG TPA: saccharopine dehydrogenase NADP-binding domain-containing protein [Solirubrobacteraceae bacterium]|nr:saccharopine dehydrogenase NADP-binding domain-containing protein [Solirubrobacteraceae bacterium]